MTDLNLEALAQRTISVCTARGIQLALAESLTGGLLASSLVAIPGASKVLLFGVVAYHDAAKHQLLGVKTVTLVTFGAVSGQTAQAMAVGAREALTQVPSINPDKVIGLATTGVAGPDQQEGKPVGCVHLGLAMLAGASTQQLQLSGTRDEIRTQAARQALILLLEAIGG